MFITCGLLFILKAIFIKPPTVNFTSTKRINGGDEYEGVALSLLKKDDDTSNVL